MYQSIDSFIVTFLTFTTTYKTFVDIHNWQTGSLGYITYLDNECGFVKYTQLSFVYTIHTYLSICQLDCYISLHQFDYITELFRQCVKHLNFDNFKTANRYFFCTLHKCQLNEIIEIQTLVRIYLGLQVTKFI